MNETVAQSWLALQCQMIPNVIAGMTAFNVSHAQTIVPTACWPENVAANNDLVTAAGLALSRQAPVVSAKTTGQSDTNNTNLIIACPLLLQNNLYGVVSVQLAAPTSQQAAVIKILQWGAVWLEQLLSRQAEPALAQSPAVFDTLSAALAHEHVVDAATAAATVLAKHFTCERVSIGLRQQLAIQVCAISHSTRFSAHSNMVRTIESAMEEAVAENKTLHYPAGPNENSASPAHARLSSNEGDHFVCSAPMMSNTGTIGAINFECMSAQQLTSEMMEQIERIAFLLGPVLEMKQKQDRPLHRKIKEDLVVAPLQHVLGPQGLKWKIALSVFALLIISGLFPGEFRITAPSVLEGKVQRVVVAPFDGFITAAYAQAGQSVSAGEILAELDDRDIKLERQKWIAQRDEYRKQYDKALASLDHAQARIAQAQVAQAAAQLALLDEHLARTQLHAPFDGVVINGDLSQSLGTSVERGQVLFEVAPLDEYRVILWVDERDISNLAAGQQGYLTLSALPDTKFPLVINKIASVNQEQEISAFRVEAQITEPDTHNALRPGMQGVAKIVAGERTNMWIWSRRLTGWLQLQLWKWLP